MSGRSESVSRLSRFLADFCAWIARHPWCVLAGCALTIGVSVWLACTRLQYRTQRDDLMSADKSCQVRWRAYLNEFGDDDDIVFVVEGSNRARMEQAVDALATELQAAPGRFDRVFHRVDLRPLRDRALLFLSETEIEAVDKRLVEMGPLLAPGAALAWQGLTLQNLIARADAIVAVREGGDELNERDRAFLQQFAAVLISAERTLLDPSRYSSPWRALGEPSPSGIESFERPRYFFSDDGSLAFLLARPAHPDRHSFTPAAEAVRGARRIVAKIRERFPELQFGMTGLPVLEHDEMAGTDRDSMRAAWLALAAIAVLYFFVYRGVRYPLLTVGSLVTGTIWALGLTAATIGHLNILSSAFAVMLIGMGDYGVLWVARFDEERKAGRDFDEALRQTAAHAGPSIITAALSTSLAFYATMFADFQAVSELGFIAGSGVLLCAVACLALIPAIQGLLNRWKPSSVQTIPFVSPFFGNPTRAWLPGIMRRPAIVMVVSAAILLVSALLAIGVRYDDNLLHLQSGRLDSVRWETKLLERTRGTGWSAVSVAATPEEAIALRRQYEQLNEVSRAEEIASLIPTDQARKLPAVQKIGQRLERLPSRDQAVSHQPVDVKSIRDGCERMLGRLEDDPDLRGAVRSLHDALVASPRAEVHLNHFNRQLSGSLWDDLDRLRQVSSPHAITLDDVPSALRERFFGSSGKWLVRAYAKEDVWNNAAMERFVAQARTVDPEATGKPFGTFEGLRALKNGFLWAGVYALLAITAVLMIDLRKASNLLLGLLPLILGVVVWLAVLRLFNISLNPANLIALPLIVGVGVDNGVHILHDYRARPPDKPYQLAAATGRGILIAALTTILGFSALMISRHQGMQSLGFALSLGVGCCMGAALIVLPAVLGLLDRRRSRRGQRSVFEETRRAA